MFHENDRDHNDQETNAGSESCGPISLEGLRDYLDAVTPILESDESLKANLYALGLAHELDLWLRKAK